MAGLTADLDVFAVQTVRGLLVVIEVPQRPGTGVMAVFAKGTELLLVLVRFLVAAETIPWRILVTCALVTSLAGRRNMASGERETRQPMVKLFYTP